MRKYDAEFKQQAIKKMFDGQSVASLSRELGDTVGVLHKWKKERLRVEFIGGTRTAGCQEAIA